jgi:hypothetical protein
MGSFFGTYLFEQIMPSDHFIRALKQLFDWDALGHELIALYAGKGPQAGKRKARLRVIKRPSKTR